MSEASDRMRREAEHRAQMNGHGDEPATAGQIIAAAAREDAAPRPASDAWSPPVPLAAVLPPEPFPLDCLPHDLAEYASHVADATSSPVDFAAAPLLAIAGGAIGASRRLAITDTHTQGASLFICAIGHPGTGKSPALEVVAAPLDVAEEVAGEIYERDLKLWEAEEEPDPKRKPKRGRVWVDDATTERLVGLLRDRPRGLIMIKDEVAGLIAGMDQYKAGGKGSDRQRYLSFWGGSRVVVDRQSNPDGLPIIVAHPFLTIVGGIQPSVVERIRGRSERGQTPPDDGLMDRFLFAYPETPPASEETWISVPESAALRWQACVLDLLNLTMVSSSEGKTVPYLHRLTPCGRREWTVFTRDHAAEVNAEDFPDHLRGPWSKLRGCCARLALIVHHLRAACGEFENKGGERLDVDGESVSRAAYLTAYFKLHCRRTYSAMALDPDVAGCGVVLRWAARKGVARFKARDVQMDLASKFRFGRVEEVEYVLDRLTKHGFIRPIAPDPSSKTIGRPPAPEYEINPLRIAQQTQLIQQNHS